VHAVTGICDADLLVLEDVDVAVMRYLPLPPVAASGRKHQVAFGTQE